MCAKLVSLVFLLLFAAAATKTNVICYYASWITAILPEAIDTSTCTHINYAFFGINPDGSLRLDGSDNVLRRVAALKKTNANLKILASVGGWNEGSVKFSKIAADATKTKRMIDSSVSYLNKYALDGIDVDWEYPGRRGGKPEDKANFVTMLQAIKTVFKQRGYLLTVAVQAVPNDVAYNAPEISKTVDFINVMTYDFHSARQGVTGNNAPLLPSPKESDWQKKNANCQAAIKNWIDKGTANSKLILGLAFYGHTFKLSDAKAHDVGSKCQGVGMNNGNLHYNQICKLNRNNEWNKTWDSVQKVPYKYNGLQWISYDSPKSIKLKVQYALKMKLAGVMVWAVNQDYDGKGGCGHRLIDGIKKPLKKQPKV